MVYSDIEPLISAELLPLLAVVATKLTQVALADRALGDAGMRNISRPMRCKQKVLLT